jgi:hypothetical protein
MFKIGGSDGFVRYNPNPQYLAGMVLATEEAYAYMLDDLECLGGEILKLDHTFKTATYIREADGQPAFTAVLTIMNEFTQILAQFMTHTKSLDELQEQLKDIAQNYEKLHLQVSMN